MTILAISNIGELASGLIDQPLLEASTLIVVDGLIAAVGGDELLEDAGADVLIDAAGATLMPGLFDSHVHPTAGDFTPRQLMHNFIESSLHGGVTSMISAGEVHYPGRPRDVAGVKALAVLAHKSFSNSPPAGVKVHGGALILEPGLTEADFVELSGEGVWLVGEVGLGKVSKPHEAQPMIACARRHGFTSLIHCGGTSLPGSSVVGADEVISIGADVVCHVNGGPTAAPDDDIRRIVAETKFTIEIVQCGNPRAALVTLDALRETGQLHRLILGNDAPSGTGVIPLGILRTMAFLASVGGLEAAKAVACATGNTARAFGLNTGTIEVGKEADLVFADAPIGSSGHTALRALAMGDLPGVSLVIIDGEVRLRRSRHTPLATRSAEIVGNLVLSP